MVMGKASGTSLEEDNWFTGILGRHRPWRAVGRAPCVHANTTWMPLKMASVQKVPELRAEVHNQRRHLGSIFWVLIPETALVCWRWSPFPSDASDGNFHFQKVLTGMTE